MGWRLSVSGVLGLCTRTRVRVVLLASSSLRKETHARLIKPYKPNTPNTQPHNQLILLGFNCVGFVLGWLNVCWVSISRAWI